MMLSNHGADSDAPKQARVKPNVERRKNIQVIDAAENCVDDTLAPAKICGLSRVFVASSTRE
jgi:hypothetical protein